MSTINMPQTPALITTPGANFLNRKSNFRMKINDFHHYKLDSINPNIEESKSVPYKKRTAVNMTLNSYKNELDPLVHASNWLPKFKGYCRGYLTRKKAAELRKKDEAVRTIQEAGSLFMDPWLQLFYTVRPTLKVIKLEELKKYLRECIIQIKKLNAERMFIENHLDDVERSLDKSLENSDSNCLSLEGRKSPNIFGKMSEIKANANNDNFLKECLDLNIDGLNDLEVNFDPASVQDSKVHSVYEKSDKVQLRIHDNQHRLQTLYNKCASLEKEIRDLRISNNNLDSTSRMMKAVIENHNQEKYELANKMHKTEEKINAIGEEKRQLLHKIRESEALLSQKNDIIEELKEKCDYLDGDLEKKIKSYTLLNQEKTAAEKKIKELEEAVNYNNEIQQELESNLEIQKARMKDMKKRFLDQIRNTEEDLLTEKNGSKMKIDDMNEQIENLLETIKHNESTIWRLEREIKESNEKDGSDEDMDHERERKLHQQLKMAQANEESLKEELKVLENNYEDLKKKHQEMEIHIENANLQETEYRKQIERLKAQIQTIKSTNNEIELNLNRANREKNYISQKWNQSRELNLEYESTISKLKDELNHQNQLLTTKTKELENLEEQLGLTKKDYESKIATVEVLHSDSREEILKTNEKLSHTQEDLKKQITTLTQELEEYKQLLEEKEIEQENIYVEKMNFNKTIKKLHHRLEEQDNIQSDYEKTIMKLKEENKMLKEEKENEHIVTVTDYRDRTRDYLTMDHRIARSNSSMNSTSPTNSSGYATLPGRGSNRY